MLIGLFLLLTLAVLLFGYLLLRETCMRRDLPDGWEQKRIDESGDAVWQRMAREGREWLARQETEELEVQSEDGFLLHGLLLPHVNPRATVLLFSGWRSSWEMDFTCILPFLHARRLQCVLIDERAQGDSEGRYITFGIRERLDVPVWVDYAAQRFGKEHPLLLQGLSMGATVVLMASAVRFDANVRGIVADCGFTSPYAIISKVFRDRTRLPPHFAVWLLDQYTRLFADFTLEEYSTVTALRETEYPVLFLHGTEDHFVPCDMTRQNYDACRGEKTLLLVEGATHGMSYLVARERVEAAYTEFLNNHIPQ
ncbi:MAG: alpha/beta hydrolase [Oscillospiraceae bacterium]|nr:alpha/beta hydrolase [Oscillospiraceae bacterium]